MTTPPEGGATDSSGADATQDERAYWEREAQKAFDARDAMRAKVREYEAREKAATEADAKRAAEAGEYKSAYEKALAQLEVATNKLRDHETQSAYIAEQLDSARSTLPKEMAEVIPESLPPVEQLRLMNKLSQFAQTQNGKPSAPPPSAPPAGTNDGGPGASEQETIEFIRNAPIEKVREWRAKLKKG